MFERADPVRDLAEVADTEILLTLHAERAVVGGDHLQVVGAQRLPHVILVALFARSQRCRAHPLGALEVAPLGAVRPELLLQREVQVLRAGLAEDVLALVASPGELLHRLLGAHVHDVERGARQVREHDRAVGRLLLHLPGTRDAVIKRCALAGGHELLGEHVDSRAILGVHHGEQADVCGLLHRADDLSVIRVEDPRVCHEHLVAGDALVDEARHRLQRLLVDAAHDLVEAVVDRAVALGFGVPCRQTVLNARAGRLHGEVDHRGRSAPGGGAGAGLEGV